MPSPLPKKIDLGFALITVRYVGAKRMRDEGECEEGDLTPEGLWDTDHDTIWVLKQSRKSMQVIICHELVHAAMDLRDA